MYDLLQIFKSSFLSSFLFFFLSSEPPIPRGRLTPLHKERRGPDRCTCVLLMLRGIRQHFIIYAPRSETPTCLRNQRRAWVEAARKSRPMLVAGPIGSQKGPMAFGGGGHPTLGPKSRAGPRAPARHQHVSRLLSFFYLGSPLIPDARGAADGGA